MSKIRIQNRFGVVPNHLLNQSDISLKAKGLFAYIQSKPDGWEFSSERIANDHTDGRDGIRAALKELEAKGYLIREKVRTESGKFEMDYLLCEEPCEPVAGTENPSRTGTEKPTPAKPTPENPATNKERETNKETERKKSFGDFWNKYPKKEGKLAAEKAFAKLNDKDKAAAIEILPEHTNHWRKKYGEPNKEKFSVFYVPHPAKWINGRRWEDVLSPVTPPPKKNSAEEYDEAKKKEERAAKVRAAEKQEEQEELKKAQEAKAARLKALEQYKNLPEDQKRKIDELTYKALEQFSGTREKFPEQYKMLRENKIISLLKTL